MLKLDTIVGFSLLLYYRDTKVLLVTHNLKLFYKLLILKERKF
jgi:hypothetical protein